MIKVLVITEEGRGGGALFRIKSIAGELSQQIETVLLCPKNSAPFLINDKIENFKVVTKRLFPLTRNLTGLIKYIIHFIPELFLISNTIKKERPDVIHCNSSWQIKGVIAGSFFNIPVIWHMNDTRQPGVVRFLFRRISKLADAFIFASNATREYYKAYGPFDSNLVQAVIPAPVDTKAITFIDRKFDQKAPVRALMIGYINKNKGIEYLINCATILKDVNISFDIAGPVLDSQKDYMKGLKNLMIEQGVTNVHYLGFQEINNDLLANYDLYICSSTNEASPIAVWQALASGIPLVSTNIGDVRDVIDQFKCGYLAESFDPKELAMHIQRLMNLSEEEKIKMSKAAREAAQSQFSLSTVAKSYLRFYTDVIGESKN